MIDKEILLYVSQPYKKYRWIGYVSIMQAGFALFSFLVMPTPKMLEERQLALVRSKEEKDEANSELPSGNLDEGPIGPRTIWEGLKKLDFGDVFSIHNVKENVIGHPYMTAGILGAASAISFAFNMYARRMGHKITLLPGERIRYEPFSAFALGKPSRIELPARHISCVIGRKSSNNFAILKFKNYRGYHLIDKTEGTFLEPKLYDEYLGYQRSWHKK